MSNIYQLTGVEHKNLVEALVSAFPERQKFKILLKHALNKNLSEIVSDKDLKTTAFEIVTAAESQGWLTDLIMAAKESVPNNPKLKSMKVDSNWKDKEQKTTKKIEIFHFSWF